MENQKIKVKWTGYVALIFGILFFSGIFGEFEGPLKALDFATLTGAFGKLGTLTEGAGTLASNFKGSGGNGARDAWMLALTLVPAVMFAMGVIKVIEHYQGLLAASVLLSPILKFIMGIPGVTGLALVAGLQSTDAGAAMAKQLADDCLLSDKERLIYVAFHYPLPGTISSYFSLGGVLHPFLAIPLFIPMMVILLSKLIGANVVRIIANRLFKEA